VDVTDAEGRICGSAYRSWQRQVIHGGDRTPAEEDHDADLCQAAGEEALRRGGYVAGAGVGVLLLLAIVPTRRRHLPLQNPGGGGR
jgi:hypothetical protein